GGAAAAEEGKQPVADGAGDFKKSGGILCQGAAVKFAFIGEHRRTWPVGVICRVLQVSRSGFYAWSKRRPSARQLRQQELLQRIRQAHPERRGFCGTPG